MTLEEKLTTVLRAICPRVWSDFAPADTPRPYVTYQQIGGEALTFIDRVASPIENAQVQINVWADSRPDAKALIKQIEEALILATSLQCEPMAAAANDVDTDMLRYSSRQDFSVWADR